MARQTVPSKSLAELKDLSADTVQQVTIRVSAVLYERIAEEAATTGTSLSRQITSSLSDHYNAQDTGVVIAFDAEHRRRLDLIADAFAATREQIVRRLVSNGLTDLLQEAIDHKGKTTELFAKLDTIVNATKK